MWWLIMFLLKVLIIFSEILAVGFVLAILVAIGIGIHKLLTMEIDE